MPGSPSPAAPRRSGPPSLAAPAGRTGSGAPPSRLPRDRRAASAELDAAIGEWTRRETQEALTSRLQEAGVAAFPVMDVVRLLADPHYRERRDFFDLGPDFPGDQLLDGNPWHLAAAPPRLRRPVPLPGQHNEEVLGELLGLTPQAVRELEAEGVVA